MDQTIIYVSAGNRSVRGVKRVCVLRVVVKNNKKVRVELAEEIPKEGELVVPVTYRLFRDMMKQHKLNFRKTIYKTEEERKAAKRRSLEKYRGSQKFRVRQMSRVDKHRTPGVLSPKDAKAIKESKKSRIALARKYGISLRHVQEVIDGKWDEGGVLVGVSSVESKPD